MRRWNLIWRVLTIEYLGLDLNALTSSDGVKDELVSFFFSGGDILVALFIGFR